MCASPPIPGPRWLEALKPLAPARTGSAFQRDEGPRACAGKPHSRQRVASDSVTLLLGATLPVAVVPELLNEEYYTYRPCRRMSARRVDCGSGSAGAASECRDMV